MIALGESLLVRPVPCPADVDSFTAECLARPPVEAGTRVLSRCSLAVTPFSEEPRSSGLAAKPSRLCPSDWETPVISRQY